jgi:DNA modification methylase
VTVPATTTAPRYTEYVALGAVARADLNPKEHDLEVVKRSIRRFGFVDGAVHDGRTDRIIAGHGRLEALQEMAAGGESAPDGIVVDADGAWLMPVQKGWSSRSDDEAASLLVVLNKATELGGWNDVELTQLLEGLAASGDEDLLGLSGFSEDDLEALRADAKKREYDEDEDPDRFDEAPDVPADPISKAGDVWILGNHRLACGDSTDPEVVKAALGGALADAVFTDPPYGVSYVGGTGLKIINDDLSASDLGRLLVAAFTAMRDNLRPGGSFYICGPSGRLETTFRSALDEVGLELRQQLVWVKDSFVLGHSDYHLKHETILYGWQLGDEPATPPPYDPEHDTVLYGWKDGAAHTWEGGRNQTSVWLYPKPKRSEVHPTMKPIALCRRGILNSTDPGGRVLDQFGGSGSTLIAAELSGRVCSTVELDPRYSDVICRRFQELTGVVPVLERTGEAVDFTVVPSAADAEAAPLAS